MTFHSSVKMKLSNIFHFSFAETSELADDSASAAATDENKATEETEEIKYGEEQI